ncbi:hypothetical protein ERJ75_001139900 [Trypanosoma vivax]|nr:hypothetical protein ERJ75_001139900 [Trypanosoma vivax]
MLGKALLCLAAVLAVASGARVAEAVAAKGIKRGSAQGACALAKVLDGAGEAAVAAAAAAAEKAQQSAAWVKEALDEARRQGVAHSETVKAIADKAQEVTQVAGLVGAAAALFGLEASTWSGRIVTTIEALGSISGSAASSGKLCIDKDNSDEATATSTQDTQYAGQLCDTVKLTASMAAALIDNDMDLDAAIAKAAKGGLGGHGNNDATLLGAILQSTNTPTTLKEPDATRTGHTTGDSSNDGKACPWTVYRGKSSGTQAGIIPKSSGAEHTVTLGALWTITPAQHTSNSNTDGPNNGGSGKASAIAIAATAQQTWTSIRNRAAELNANLTSLQRLCAADWQACAAPDTHGRKRLAEAIKRERENAAKATHAKTKGDGRSTQDAETGTGVADASAAEAESGEAGQQNSEEDKHGKQGGPGPAQRGASQKEQATPVCALAMARALCVSASLRAEDRISTRAEQKRQ